MTIDLSNGYVWLEDKAPPLRPRMTLREFAQSPLAKGFRRGFEKRHFKDNGYLIGVYRLCGTNFAVSLGFTSPTPVISPGSVPLIVKS